MSIQIKRGMKKDLPQLKDGELAFCKDTKELYVGNNGNENVSVTKKIEDRLDAVDSQLEQIKTNTKNEILLEQIKTNTKNEILKEKKENILREKLGILSQVEIMKQSELLINTAELINLKQSESNYINSINNLIAIIDKLLEGGNIDG